MTPSKEYFQLIFHLWVFYLLKVVNYSATNNLASCFNFHCLINTKLYFQVLYDIWNRQSYLETSKGKLSSTATSKSSLSILVNSSISEKFPLNAGELYSLYRTVKAWSLLLFHSVMELRMCHPNKRTYEANAGTKAVPQWTSSASVYNDRGILFIWI